MGHCILHAQLMVLVHVCIAPKTCERDEARRRSFATAHKTRVDAVDQWQPMLLGTAGELHWRHVRGMQCRCMYEAGGQQDIASYCTVSRTTCIDALVVRFLESNNLLQIPGSHELAL